MATVQPNIFGANHPDFGIGAFSITKSDSVLTPFWKLFIGGTGDVTIDTFDGNTVTFTAVPAGTTIPCSGMRVRTASTATAMVGLT